MPELKSRLDGGRLVETDKVEVSDRAERVASVTGIDLREIELIHEESDVLGVIPVGEDVISRREPPRGQASRHSACSACRFRTPIQLTTRLRVRE